MKTLAWFNAMVCICYGLAAFLGWDGVNPWFTYYCVVCLGILNGADYVREE